MVFWKKKPDAGPPEHRVEAVLTEAGEALAGKPKEALKLLDGLKGDAYPLVTFGGPYHERFSRIVGEALGMTGGFPGVSAFPWDRWEDFPTVADVLALAGEAPEPVLYLYEPPGRLSRGPATELEGLKHLTEDEQLAMVVVGEMNVFLRRDPLLSLAGRADPSTEEILEELVGAFERSGYRTLSIVG